MLSVRDLTGNEEPFVHFNGLKRSHKVNAEKIIELVVFPTEKNDHSFNLIEEESIINALNDEYVIKKLTESSKGERYVKEATAIHKFYVDLINKHQPKTHNGSITFRRYMEEFVFDGMGFEVIVTGSFPARTFQNLGNDNRLSLLQKGLERFKAEFELVGNQVRFHHQIGNDTDIQFRYGHNVKAIKKEVDTTNLATVIRGTGDNELGIEAYYRSPNADIFGEIDAPPVDDERFKSEPALLEEMISRLEDTPTVSLTVDFVDLRAAGYPYSAPSEGDRVFVIYEPMNDLLIETRILEIVEYFKYDESSGNLIPYKTEVTLSNQKKTFAGTMFENVQKQLSRIVNEDGIVKYSVLDEAVRIATEILVNDNANFIYAPGYVLGVNVEDPNQLVRLTSQGLGISSDGGQTFPNAITGKGIVADAITTGTLRAIDIIGTNIMSYNTETNDVITLENGRIETFESGKRRFGVYGDGLVAYHWETEQEVATFRASHVNGEYFGADIMGWGDFLSIGRHIEGGTSRSHVDIDWSGDYDVTRITGATRSVGGVLRLRSISSNISAAGANVPNIEIENHIASGTEWNRVAIWTGRAGKSPSASNYRGGFEVRQFTGDINGTSNLMLDIDTNSSGVKYIDAWVDRVWVDGKVETGEGLIVSGDTDFYGQVKMNGWALNVDGRLNFNYERGWRFDQFNSGAATSLGLHALHGLKSFKVADPELYTVLDVRVGNNGNDGRVEVFGDFHVTGSKNALVQTENYGKRLMYADESTGSFFNTRIHKRALAVGRHTIEIDKMYLETVSDYLVLPFVRNGAEVHILEENESSFVVGVIGKPADVVFYITGTRKGFEGVYMEEFGDDEGDENKGIQMMRMGMKQENSALVKPKRNYIVEHDNKKEKLKKEHHNEIKSS